MSEIVLTTLNARYAHASFGLRYLLANLGELRPRTALLEFDISQRSVDVVESVLKHEPKIVGVGVYIWNAVLSLQVVAELKRIRPDITVILGGPEVSYETDQQEICRLADYVITGEGDITFADLCRQIVSGRRPLMKAIPAELPQFDSKAANPIALPYDLYTDSDIAHRVIYVEASRGCPFKCEFCLSSLDVPVRNVPLDAFLNSMQRLLDRGAQSFKFVDRTFNLNLNFSQAILKFFLERLRPDLFLHFEMIPDRLPEALRSIIKQFPAGSLQFEVGVQTFNEEVSERISRKQDNAKLADNLRFLRDETGVHVHTDLIVGLPGEDIQSFGAGFDRLVSLHPQEIQVGILKRLRGTPIVRHDAQFEMVYSPLAPYEVLQTKEIDFATMQRLRRFSRYWDLVANSGNFVLTTPLIWQGFPARSLGERRGEGLENCGPFSDEHSLTLTLPTPMNTWDHRETGQEMSSPFWRFLSLSDWLYSTTGQTHAISLQRLAELIFRFLTEMNGVDTRLAANAIWKDYQRAGRSDRPAFLQEYLDDQIASPPRRVILESARQKRQARHSAKSS